MDPSRQLSEATGTIGVLSVLCVDDDPDILTIVSLSLRLDANVEVALAGTGDEALRRLASSKHIPDCILLDVRLPDIDGKLLLEEIRALDAHRATPVIFLTSQVGEKDREDCLASGALGVIAKPFDPLKLTAELRSILKQKPS